MATRDVVALSGGGRYSVQTGRRDGVVSRAQNTRTLPPLSASVSSAIQAFANKGLTSTDMIYLLGGHTIGIAHCSLFQDRLYNFQNTGKPDPTMDSTLLSSLRRTQIMFHRGVLQIDQELALDSLSKSTVEAIARLISTPSLIKPWLSWGCDGSVLLDDTFTLQGEKKAPTNLNALKGFEIIDRIKNKLESECPGIVSCADALTIAARDAVFLVGGPYWHVPVGRKDSNTTSSAEVESNIPGANDGLLSIIGKFMYQSLSVTDMVALSGAHTIGMARCTNYRARIYGDYQTTATMSTIAESNLKTLKSIPLSI